MKNITAIILAAGEGTRMKSQIPKVLHPICARPMLGYVLDLAKELRISKSILVLGHKKELFEDFLKDYNVKVTYQLKQLGTADALKKALAKTGAQTINILVLYGDQPLLKRRTLEGLIRKHIERKADATILTAMVDSPYGYGRVVRDNFSRITSIVEEKDASEGQREINEINTGIICFKKQALLRAILRIKPNNAKKEYYLTDAIKIMSEQGLIIDSVTIDDMSEAQGINSQADLAKAEKAMRLRIIQDFMVQGVRVKDPENTFIDAECKIGRETVIYPFTVIEKNVKIGKFCQIGPFCHLRQDSVIDDYAVIGNFTELVRSHIGKNTWMKHFSYLGDAVVGKGANIGCGAVSANFDGKNKQKTHIGDQAFIGSDTILRAPVKVGRKAITGAGSVVTKDVKAGSVVIGVPARLHIIKSKKKP